MPRDSRETRPRRVVEVIGTKALRAYGKAGPKAWKRASAERLHRAIADDIEAIRLTDPRLAALCVGGFETTLDFLRRPAGLSGLTPSTQELDSPIYIRGFEGESEKPAFEWPGPALLKDSPIS